MLTSAKKDDQQITSSWDKIQDLIDGVSVTEVRHVPRDHGVITEIYRPEWDPSALPVVHCYQSRLFVGALGAWSCHQRSVDRLFVNEGHVKVVLYDGREDSPTYGKVNEINVGDARPTFIVLPTGVWHGLQNVGPCDALVLNFPSEAYRYDDPDHWRLPWDTDEIPYSWSTGRNVRTRAK